MQSNAVRALYLDRSVPEARGIFAHYLPPYLGHKVRTVIHNRTAHVLRELYSDVTLKC
jgi:hypothetical protein